MKLLPKPQITLLVDAETGREYKYIPYRLLETTWIEERKRMGIFSETDIILSNPGPEHDR